MISDRRKTSWIYTLYFTIHLAFYNKTEGKPLTPTTYKVETTAMDMRMRAKVMNAQATKARFSILGYLIHV